MPPTTGPTRSRILIADDQPDVLDALKLLLQDEGCTVDTAKSPAEVLARIEGAEYDLAILDLNYTRDTTSGQEGLDLLDRIRAIEPEQPVVVMTAWSSVPSAVEAMRRGARDYVEKPWDDERLAVTVRNQIDLRRAVRRSRRMEEAANRTQRVPVFIAESPAMQAVQQTIERVAPSDASVLITGEHGTGKEVVAAWLHARSDRRQRPMVTMNAGGISEGIAESELFGHVKGAFTDARADRIGCFELADEGTLFLDEIGNMPIKLQPKLLRVLQTGEVQRVGSSQVRFVNVRVISATNTDLRQAIGAGRFREDLFYRLNTVEVHLPPLRDRREDVEPLAAHFLARYAARYGKTLDGFDAEARKALRAYTWPGNVRELAHAIERAVLMVEPSGRLVREADLALRAQVPVPVAAGVVDDLPLEEIERLFIRKAIARHGGDIRRAAAQLGLSRSALYRRLQHYEETGE